MNKDIIILIPVDGKLKSEVDADCSVVSEAVAKALDEVANYECDEMIASAIQRYPLGSMQLSYMDDEYVPADEEGVSDKIEWLNGHITISYLKGMELGIVQLFIPQCGKEVTQIGDMISSKHTKIKDGENIWKLEDYVEEKFGLKVCGKIRTVYCMGKNGTDKREIEYMLAGESGVSVHSDFDIKNDEIEQMACTNLASYNFYELFASPNGVVYCIEGFSESVLENMEREALLLFICEIAVLQNAALSRINKLIIRELMTDSNISPYKTLKLQVEFGKTILLWDNNIYNYYMAQKLSDKIIEAFGTEKLFAEYKRNKEHIEQIAAIKSGIASEIEGRVLNILAFVLSMNELFQLIVGLKNYISGVPVQYGVIGGASLALIIVLIAVIRSRRKRKK